ncbi:hypothetical protein MTP09_08860 [Chryseobacterium suipulveris]|uniref:Glycosyltransferase RgtA/B/C/D-like domain-containing protein n=1 Tax=Chryseobacterium suipulveris TaxID=2929800 RepID=A0ABY4BTX4_9FLAO|nr:hypothetical protein [Chryseobacterium suipulveris]UOE40030.1 hypothetical protein MTP09_08860 [Chryseobacterium suipulveris]
MRRCLFERRIQTVLMITTLVMIILRFLLNEKGRTNPDSIRFMRTSDAFPVIDNTVTPLGYPLSLKLFSIIGIGEFWGSKFLGIVAFLFIVYFAWKKKFYVKETILVCGLFSFVSIFSYTMSEVLILPFVFVFLFVARQIIIDELKGAKAFLLLSLMLVILYNIRYSSLFFIGAVFLYGVINFCKHFGKTFVFSSLVGFGFVVLYKLLFIDYFDEKYVQNFLNIGLHPTSKLLVELFQGLATTFNPFIHIANPGGGIINYAIYGIGFLNILLMIFLFVKGKLSESEKFLIFAGIIGIICSYFIQYFYSVNAIDYRLLAPFSFPIWMVYFKKLYGIFGKLTYSVTVLSLMTGFVFTWLSKGNYLENRRTITKFLVEENLEKGPIKFYLIDEQQLNAVQIAELISTVNPNVSITFKPQDTIKKNVLTPHKVLRKIKIDTNKFQ